MYNWKIITFPELIRNTRFFDRFPDYNFKNIIFENFRNFIHNHKGTKIQHRLTRTYIQPALRLIQHRI